MTDEHMGRCDLIPYLRAKKQTSPPWGPDSKSNSRGWGRQLRSNAPHMPGVPPPPPLGLNIDRCIIPSSTCILINFLEKFGININIDLRSMIALGIYYFIVFRGVWFRGVGIFFETDNRLYFKKECHGNKIICCFLSISG